MSILEDLSALLKSLGLPFETGVYSRNAPDKYIVLLPLEDSFSLFGDNRPGARIEEARISIFAKGSYLVTTVPTGISAQTSAPIYDFPKNSTPQFTIELNISNFNNYGVEDIRQLTNEVMETANSFMLCCP